MDGLSHVVAIVDDDPGVCRSLRRLVRTFGHEAQAFASANGLLFGANPTPPTDVLLDLHLTGFSGPPLVARIRERWPDAKILVMSGRETAGAAEACLAAGADLFLSKPLRPADIRRFLNPTDHPAD